MALLDIHCPTKEDVFLLRTEVQHGLPGLLWVLRSIEMKNVHPVNWDTLMPRCIDLAEIADWTEIDEEIEVLRERDIEKREAERLAAQDCEYCRACEEHA